MSTVVTGAAYVAALSAHESDRRSRAAFQALALGLARPGGAVFDFGCGPGVDARLYAEHGLRVGAYDVDAAMCAHFRLYCATALARGQVTLVEGLYEDFLRSPPTREYSLVTANFAPLNLVPDVRVLFARLAALLAPGGRLLASVLNPWCPSDLRYGWWWRGLPSLLSRGELRVPGAQGEITRFAARHLESLARPWFTVEAWHAERAFPCRYHFVILRLTDTPP